MLLIARNGDVHVGQPTLEGARVIAEVVEHGRDRKILVFKYKAKTRYRRRRGHRQGYTRLAVRQILTAGEPAEAEAKPKRRRPAKAAGPEAKPARRTRARKAPEPKAEAPEATAAPVEAAEPEAKPARRTRVRRAAAPADEAKEAEAKPARKARARKPETEEPTASAEEKPARRARGTATKGEAEKPKRARRKAESD